MCVVTKVNERECKTNSENLWEMKGTVDILNKDGKSNEVNVYAINDSEIAISRFFLAKNKAYIIIFTKVEKADDEFTLHVQRGMMIQPGDLETVKTNFSFSAKQAFHRQLSTPTANTPTNFTDLAKELKTPRKRAFTFGAATEEVSQELAFTTLPSPKKLRISP